MKEEYTDSNNLGETAESVEAVSETVSDSETDAAELQKQLIAERERAEGFEAEIGRLRESLGEADVLKNKVEELQKTIDAQKAAENEAQRKRILQDRFLKAADGAEFINDFTRDGLLREFEGAVCDEANEGVEDSEVFDRLVSGRSNLFAPRSGIPSVVAASSGALSALSDDDVREVMGLSARSGH